MNTLMKIRVLGIALVFTGGLAQAQSGAGVSVGAERLGKEELLIKEKRLPGSLGQSGRMAAGEQGNMPGASGRWIREGDRGYSGWDGKIDPDSLKGLNNRIPRELLDGRGLSREPDLSGEDPRVTAIIKSARLKKYALEDLVPAGKRLDVPPEWGLASGTIKRPASSCPQCQEVDPGPAGVVLTEVHKLPPLSSPAAVVALGIAGQDSAACSAAVKQMRLQDNSGYSLIDDERFQRQCLSTGADGRPGLQGEAQKPLTAACFALYAQFDQKCLETTPSKRDEALLQQAGILVRVVPGLPMKILCSAWRASATAVLTARHCLAEEQLLAPGQTAVASAALTFLPYAEAKSVRFDPQRRRFGHVVTGEIGKDGSALPLSYPRSRPKIDEDMVLLSVAGTPPGLYETARPLVAVPAQSRQGSYMTVIGFQEFVYRAYLSGARLREQALPTDEVLVASGEWRKFMRVHRSPICRSLVSDRGSLRHYCQTYGRTSGAPMFTFDSFGPGSAATYLVGVQSRGLAGVEAARANNEAVAVRRGVHPYLDSILGGNKP